MEPTYEGLKRPLAAYSDEELAKVWSLPMRD